MEKRDLISEVVSEMHLDRAHSDKLNVLLTVKLADYELKEVEMLPSVQVYDNEFLLKRFSIDSMAKGNHDSTIKGYVTIANKFLKDTGLNYRDVTGQHIIDYIAIREYRDHISKNYKATVYRYLNVFFKWAYKRHYIDSDIMNDVDVVKGQQKKKERLSDAELEDMRDVCESLREKALFELLASTGMRVGEVSNANISDIDFSDGTISIYGEKTDTYRTGYLTVRALKAIKAYISEREVAENALFISDRSKERLGKSSIEKISKEIGKRAGVKKKTTVHLYRKTFCSIMYLKTKDILYVSKLMGHASPDVTAKSYLVDDVEEMKHRYKIANN